jgi:hypothetical protein
MVQPDAAGTLVEVVNSLIYVVDTMPLLEQIVADSDENGTDNDDDLIIRLNRIHYMGLKNLIECSKSAIESCCYQHNHELLAKDQLIRQLKKTVV